MWASVQMPLYRHGMSILLNPSWWKKPEIQIFATAVNKTLSTPQIVNTLNPDRALNMTGWNQQSHHWHLDDRIPSCISSISWLNTQHGTEESCNKQASLWTCARAFTNWGTKKQWESRQETGRSERAKSWVINTTQAVSSPLSWPQCAFVRSAYSLTPVYDDVPGGHHLQTPAWAAVWEHSVHGLSNPLTIHVKVHKQRRDVFSDLQVN